MVQFASYLRRVLAKTRLTFSRINGPIEEISKKISAGLSVLKRISPTIPFETGQIMYKALILPYIDYSSCVWGYIGIGLTGKLQHLQNRAARIVTLSNYETRSKDPLDDLGWEVLVDRRMRKLAILMYKNSRYFPAVFKKHLSECF